RGGLSERPACPRRERGRDCAPAALDRALLDGPSTSPLDGINRKPRTALERSLPRWGRRFRWPGETLLRNFGALGAITTRFRNGKLTTLALPPLLDLHRLADYHSAGPRRGAPRFREPSAGRPVGHERAHSIERKLTGSGAPSRRWSAGLAPTHRGSRTAHELADGWWRSVPRRSPGHRE